MSDEACRKIGAGNAGPYPAFINVDTGDEIPAGINLTRMCRERGLITQNMHKVIQGKRKSHRGWILKEATTDADR